MGGGLATAHPALPLSYFPPKNPEPHLPGFQPQLFGDLNQDCLAIILLQVDRKPFLGPFDDLRLGEGRPERVLVDLDLLRQHDRDVW